MFLAPEEKSKKCPANIRQIVEENSYASDQIFKAGEV